MGAFPVESALCLWYDFTWIVTDFTNFVLAVKCRANQL
jgi:hypothetical protein